MASMKENSLQMRLDKRRGTMSEVDRTQFEKQQSECIAKAIRNEEVPAKEKHVRRTIIGTWQERGNSMFWNVLGKQPLPSQAVMCWKSLTVMHKILREGHPNVLKDSYVYRTTLRDLFSIYRFQSGTYGPLISEYLKVLQTKLELHHKYPGIPGSLTFSEENPIKIPQKDINDIFTFAVESLDYLDLLLTIEENVFKTLDKSKNNSLIASSQCRIATLGPLLKECSGMYDLLVYVITKLHKNLPPETLDGHRQRFYSQHRRLRTFCLESAALMYITNLMSIPAIPDQPPDFLIHKYYPKSKPEKPKEEPKPIQITPQIDERDVLIEQLMREIEELRQQLDMTEKHAAEMENRLRMQLLKFQEELRRLENIAKQTSDENVFLKEQLDGVGKEDTDAQEKAKSADEKFNKLKLLYGKLRQEHIELLRKNAEIKQKEDAAEKTAKDLEEELNKINEELLEKEKALLKLKEEKDVFDKANQNLKIDFDRTDQGNKDKLKSLMDDIESLKYSLDESEKKRKNLENNLEDTRRRSDEQMKALSDQLQDLTTGKITEESARKSAEDAINVMRSDNEQVKSNLESQLTDTKALLSREEQSRKDAEERMHNLTEDMSNQILRLKQEIEKLSNEKQEEENAKNNAQTKLEGLQSDSATEIKNLSSTLEELELAQQAVMSEREKLQQEFLQKQTEFGNQVSMLSSELQELSAMKDIEEQNRKAREDELRIMEANNKEKFEEEKRKNEDDILKAKLQLLSSTARECEEIINDSLEIFNNVKHESGTTCTAEYLKSRLDGLSNRVQNTSNTYSSFHSTQDDVLPVVHLLNTTCHHVSDTLIHGKATSHMASKEDSENLVSSCKSVGQATLVYIKGFENHSDSSIVIKDGENLQSEIAKVLSISEELIPKQSDSSDNVENMVDEEMHATERVVADAAARIEEILNKSRKHHSGVQLEVNERILDSCTGLMKAIQELILKAKNLQDEIVAEGKGSASVTEFYKRHHKWTEGLLSAAKSVGYGATILVDAADKVIERKGKFEELVVASHEIAASTAQLVAASRVKASKYSKTLPPLMTASKGVGEATAGVVAAVRSGASMAEESATQVDYSKMSLTQAKRYEMDSQVKILELESLLQKERATLGKLRKAHYQIAVELYGEEQVNMD